MKRFSLLLTLVCGLAAAQTAVDLESAPVNRVAKKLACSCGCAQDMTCQMEPGCGVCKRAKTKIFEEQKAGKSDSQIIAGFVAEGGGNKALFTTPGTFGTMGPFVALCLGAIVVMLVIRRYRTPHTSTGPGGPAPEIDSEVLERINKDMAKLD